MPRPIETIWTDMAALAEYLTPEAVTILDCPSKAEALSALAAHHVGVHSQVDLAELTAAIHQREKLMSTGIGQALAIPHVRLSSVKSATISVALNRRPLDDYESLDNLPVRLLVLIVAPAGKHEIYLQLLSQVVAALKADDVRNAVMQAEAPGTIFDAFLKGQP